MTQQSAGLQRRTLLKTIGVATSAAVAGCGMSESDPNQEHEVGVSTPENPQSSNVAAGAITDAVTVRLTAEDGEKRFDPAIVQTVPGGTVTWESAMNGCEGCEDTSFSVTAYHAGNDKPHRVPNGTAPFDSGELSQDESFSHTFENKGVYNYVAEGEEANGTVGIVIVGDPPAVNEPGLAPPQNSIADAASERLETLVADTKTRLSLPLVADVNMRGTNADDTQEFDPQVIRVREGGAVRFHNESGRHTATAYHPDNGEEQRVPQGTEGWNSGMLEEGDTFTQRLDTEGVYDYYCQPHEANGMVGTIVVGTPDLDGQPAMQPPQDLPEAASETLDSAHEEVSTLLSAASAPSNTGGDTDTPTSNDSDDVTVVTTGTTFSPDLISIDVGDSVTWEIKGMQHTVTAYEDRIPDGAEAFDSGFVEPDETFTHTFETEGVYDYYCEPHRSMGMVGTVIVGDPGEDQPGLAEPGSEALASDALSELNDRARSELGVDGSAGSEAETGDGTNTSTASNFKFEPEVIKVEAGDTVTWDIDGSGVHTITAYEDRIPDDAETFDSGNISSDETFSHTFETEGVYDYFCSPHEAMGMVGTVVVGSPSDSEPGLSEPSVDFDDAQSKLEELNQTVKDEYGGGGAESSGSDSSDESDDSGGDMTVDEWLSETSNYDGTKADKTGQDSVTIEVGAQANNGEYGFSPPAVKVDKGTEVTWEWVGSMGHNVVAKDGSFMSGDSDTDTQKSGTWSRTFDSDGTYAYYCFPHKTMGMKGVVIVGEGGGIGGSESDESSSSDDSGGGGEMTVDEWLSDTSNYDGETDKTGQDSVTVEVGASANNGEYGFSPPAVKVDKGTEVTWEWVGAQGHNVVAKDGSFKSGSPESSGTWSKTFDSDGAYAYYCKPHKGMGMKGVVIVGEGGTIGGSKREKPDLSNVDIDESLPKTAHVNIDEDDWPRFEPRIVHIRRGGTVTWEWTSGDMPHSVSMNSARSPENGFEFGTALETEPHSYENKFWMEGVFQYYCLVPEHRTMMKAMVIVGNPDPDEEPALEPADPTKPGAETMAELVHDTREYLEGNKSLAQVANGHDPEDYETAVDLDDDQDAESFDNVDTSLPEAVDVGIPSDEFEPRIVHIRKGGTVTWHWGDGVHSVTANSDRIPDGASYFATDMQEEGHTWEHTFNTEGVYSYYCIYEGHKDDMTGMVIVGNPDPDNQPALDPVEAGEPGYEDLPELIDQVESILNNDTTASQTSDGGESSHGGPEVSSLSFSVTDGTPQQGETVTLQLTGDGSPLSGVEVLQEKPRESTYTTDDNGEITVTLSGGEDFRFEADYAGESARKEWEFDN